LAQEGELCMKLPSGFFYPLVNLDLLLFYTSSVKLCLQYFVSLFTNLAWTPATVKEENLHGFKNEAGHLCTLPTIAGATVLTLGTRGILGQ